MIKPIMDYKLLCKKHNVSQVAFYERKRRGWDEYKAATTPLISQAALYTVKCDDKFVYQCHGTTRLSKYLSSHLHYTITKNALIGQFYRKGYARFENYVITKEEKNEK